MTLGTLNYQDQSVTPYMRAVVSVVLGELLVGCVGGGGGFPFKNNHLLNIKN